MKGKDFNDMAIEWFWARGTLVFWVLLLTGPLEPELISQPLMDKCAPGLLNDARSDLPRLFYLVVDDADTFDVKRLNQGVPLDLIAYYQPAHIAFIRTTAHILREQLLPLRAVRFADRGHLTPREEQPVPGHNLFVNNIRVVHSRQPALDGTGITLSIKEFGFDTSDVDLGFHFLPTPNSASVVTPHATIMATLAAGAGNSDPAGRGVARAARLVSSNYVGLLPDDATDYDLYEISVQNHSYGVDIENYYGALALAYDKSMLEHPGLLHVFSAGNKGGDASTSGPYASVSGFANLTGNFKMAKNILVVGAVDSFSRVLPFSSRGPAYDGRVKPDLVAFSQDGTSGAAALVSGAAALVRQAYFEKFGLAPSSEAVKAVLVGSADDVGAAGPDFISGYGNLNLKKAVDVVEHQLIMDGEAAAGAQELFEVNLPGNVRQAKITLSWNDPPALPNATPALLNDLDLWVRPPTGPLLYPWVLNTSPHSDSLVLPARTGRDSLNTVEQIVIDHPAAGTYQIFVQGHAIPNDAQAYALAICWDTLQHFEWTCPVNNDPAFAAKEAILRWETTISGITGHVDWKPVGADQWLSVEPDVSIETGYLRWLTPDTFTAAQIRMRISGKEFVSDTFLITPPLRVEIGFNCPDSLLLRWNAVAPATLYQVSGLGGKYLEPLLVTADTFVVLNKSDYPQLRFTVSPLSGDTSSSGPFSATPDVSAPGIGCYVNTFLAQLNVENQVDLALALGSLYGVRQIILEKLQNGAWVSLYNENPTALQVFFTDVAPLIGANTYRARLEMENGGSITGDAITVYSAGEKQYVALPNPVSAGNPLYVLSVASDETPQFVLYDALGILILEKELDDVLVAIDLPALPPGYYTWRVSGGTSKILAQGKLLLKP